jgi:hypothetical protein
VKKLQLLMLLLTMTGCGRLTDEYNPHLASQPNSASKYESDRKACIADAHSRYGRNVSQYYSSGASFFGPIGALASAVAAGPNSDYNMSPLELANDCMTKRGYILTAN